MIKQKNSIVFQGPFHFFGGDFGGLILYLGFWGLDLEIWSRKQMGKGTLAIFFLAFWN